MVSAVGQLPRGCDATASCAKSYVPAAVAAEALRSNQKIGPPRLFAFLLSELRPGGAFCERVRAFAHNFVEGAAADMMTVAARAFRFKAA